MAIDISKERSAGWWLNILYAKLNEKRTWPTGVTSTRQARFDLLWSYFVGNPPLPGWTADYQEYTREYMRLSRQNYALLSVEVELNRQRLLGVRTVVDDDPGGDDEFRRLAQQTGFSLAVQDAVMFKKVMSEGYLMVGWSKEDDRPTVTGEDPRNIAVYIDPATGIVRAGIKAYHDELLQQDVVHVLTPGRVDVAVRPNKGTRLPARFVAKQWEWDDERSNEYPVAGTDHLVPLIPFLNRYGMGKFEPHLDTLDRITESIADGLWTSKVQAYRQLALMAKDIPQGAGEDYDPLPDVDPLTGKKIDYDSLLKRAPDAVWRLPPGVTLWESQATDTRPNLEATKSYVLHFATATGTPMSYFIPDAAGQSAEGARNFKDQLNANTKDSIARDDRPVLDGARALLTFAGHADRARGELSTIWAPVDQLSLPEMADAASKAGKSQLPAEIVFSEILQLPPAIVARALRLRAREQVIQAGAQATIETQARELPATRELAAGDDDDG